MICGPRRLLARRSPLVSSLACILLAGFAPAVHAFVPRPVPGRVLLTIRDGVDLSGVAAKPGSALNVGLPRLDVLGARFHVTQLARIFPGATSAGKSAGGADLSRFLSVDFPPEYDLETVRAAYAADPSVKVAEYDWLCPMDQPVNDSGSQWYLESSAGKDAHVTGGWSHSVGDTTVLLGIADSGVDWQHPDLGGTAPKYADGNVWINWPEMNGLPGFDDDNNGLVDDVRGWDFVGNLPAAWPGEDASGADNDPRDFNGHGTHVAGIAGATTNNGTGVAGVGFKCKIMALRIGGSVNDAGSEEGVVLMSAAAAAINYAVQKGVVAINCSWGSSPIGALIAAVDNAVAHGVVICVAAGNDNNQVASYLGSRGDCFDVAASQENDYKADFSSFGPWVDISAPGVNIYSTYFDHTKVGPAQHTYATLQGTSMATPVVTGMCGLVKSRWAGYSGTTIIATIRAGADNLDILNPGYTGLLGSGRVNALRTFGDRFLTVPNDYSSLDRALSASGAGDTIACLGGATLNTAWYLGKSKRLIQGGWNASFTQRDPLHNPTLVQPFSSGPALEIVAQMDSTLVVDGVRFTAGRARTLGSPLAGIYGGGVLCLDASPKLVNCQFSGNTAGDVFTFGGGGGGFFANSSAKLVNCTFSGNSAQAGAGLYLYNSSVRLQNCTIQGNTLYDGSSPSYGGGLLVEGGAPTLSAVRLQANTGADEGGGLYLKSGTVSATGSSWIDNSATSYGGGIRLLASTTVTLTGCEVRGSTAPFGAGISALNAAAISMAGCVFSGNIAGVIGGGIYAISATATFTNVTWNANQAAPAGGEAVYAVSCPSAWTVRNCLVSNHTGNMALAFSGVAPQLDYNTYWNNPAGHVTGGSLGAHDTVADPLYVNAGAGDLALGIHSPALDSGDPAPAWNDRDGSRADRGAYGGPSGTSRAPRPPAGLTVVRQVGPTRNVLTWTANPEADVKLYAVYRGGTSTFVPSAANYLSSTSAATHTFTDAGGSLTDYYRLAAVDSSDASSGFSPAAQPSTTGVPPPAPGRFALEQNEPNPFNPSTHLRFTLPRAAEVRLEIFDASGRPVRRLVTGWMQAGPHDVSWDGMAENHRATGSGVYLYRLSAAGSSAAHKMVLVR